MYRAYTMIRWFVKNHPPYIAMKLFAIGSFHLRSTFIFVPDFRYAFCPPGFAPISTIFLRLEEKFLQGASRG
jgi:hypothetical protein